MPHQNEKPIAIGLKKKFKILAFLCKFCNFKLEICQKKIDYELFHRANYITNNKWPTFSHSGHTPAPHATVVTSKSDGIEIPCFWCVSLE